MVAGLLVGALAPLWGPPVLRRFAFFDVRRVEVVGARYLAPEVVVAALGLGEGSSVFESRGRMVGRLESVPGIEAAEVHRRLPGTLVVSVREAEPVALVEGPDGLVAMGVDGRPLPYDPVRSPVDAPVTERADRALLEALSVIQRADPELYTEVSTAAAGPEGVTLQVREGRIRLGMPVDVGVVMAVSAVRSDLAARSVAWRELDGRFRSWVVVRRASSGTAPAVATAG